MLVLSLIFFVSQVFAIEKPGDLEGKVGVFTELGTKVDIDAALTSEKGQSFTIKDLLSDGKPLIVVPAYYSCPRLCGLLLDGVTNLVNDLQLKLGKDYKILVISFDPADIPQRAAEKAQKFRDRIINKTESLESDFIFSTASPHVITKIMNQLGFFYIPDGKDFAHSAAIMLLTPGGEISQYFTGIQFTEWDVRLALIEASSGAIGSAIDHLLLYCFRFDPLQGKYTWTVFATLRIGGVLTLVILALVYYLFIMKKRA